MRKVTSQAVEAFNNSKSFKSGNTSVIKLYLNVIGLYLHDNLIARKYSNGVVEITTAGWNTPTTKERLNGLEGVSVYTQKGQLYLNGNVWDGSWVKV